MGLPSVAPIAPLMAAEAAFSSTLSASAPDARRSRRCVGSYSPSRVPFINSWYASAPHSPACSPRTPSCRAMVVNAWDMPRYCRAPPLREPSPSNWRRVLMVSLRAWRGDGVRERKKEKKRPKESEEA